LAPKSKVIPRVSEAQKEVLYSQVMETVAGVLGIFVGQDDPLMDAGLDSLGSVELRNGLFRLVGMELPGTLVFDYPSVGALAQYVETHLVSTQDSAHMHATEADEEVLCTGWRARKKACGKKQATPSSSKVKIEALHPHVVDTVAVVLGKIVGSHEPLMDAGLDSLGSVELRNGLSRSVGMELPGTFVFDYPSIGSLSGYLQTHLSRLVGEVERSDENTYGHTWMGRVKRNKQQTTSHGEVPSE
jgi:acyl carrier protein